MGWTSMYFSEKSGEHSSSAGQVVEHSFLPSVPLPKNLKPGPIAISDMANAFGVTHRTLHFYEEKRLISADRIGAMRVYSARQMHVMAVVNLCRETGMPIAQLQELMAELALAASQAEADQIFQNAMTARKRELTANQSIIRRQMQQINELLEHGQNLYQVDDIHRLDRPFLTDEEHKCLGLMAEGHPPARLAAALNRSLNDILRIEQTIIGKFDAHNRFQAVAKAVLLGIIAG